MADTGHAWHELLGNVWKKGEARASLTLVFSRHSEVMVTMLAELETSMS